MGRRLRTLALAAAVLLVAGAAGSAEIEVVDHASGHLVILAGTILRSDVAAMTALLEGTSDLREVRFDSRGGSLEAGIDIGEAIRARRLATRVTVGSVCASACVYAFLGGVIRAVDAGGRIGIHMASAAFNDAYVDAVKQVLLDPAGGVDAKVRTIILLNEQFSAIAARRQARHLARMGVSLRLLDPVFDTSHLDIHWLTPFELRDYNVVN